MFYAARNNNKLPGLDPLAAFARIRVAKFHAEAAFYDQKHFVFMVVVVPDERSVGLDQFDHLAVEFADDVGLVVFRDFGEFLGDVDLVHAMVLSEKRWAGALLEMTLGRRRSLKFILGMSNGQ